MAIRKIIAAGCLALSLFGATAAQAGGIDVDINLGGPAYYPAPMYLAPPAPVYYVQAPEPVYVTPYYYPSYYAPRYRGQDNWYWERRNPGRGHYEHGHRGHHR